jgi:hypothetical protein
LLPEFEAARGGGIREVRPAVPPMKIGNIPLFRRQIASSRKRTGICSSTVCVSPGWPGDSHFPKLAA